MKPHSLRRVLWIANLALAAAVVGVVAWFWLEVKPAAAAVSGRVTGYQPEELKALRKEYETMRVTGLKWQPEAPVSEQEITDTIIHPEFAKLDPKHWIFSGPVPPVKMAEIDSQPAEPAQPQGLEVLGKVQMIFMETPSASTFLFAFGDGKTKAFGIGDFVRLAETDPKRFLVTDIIEVRSSVYEIRYDVFGKDPGKAERSGTLLWDRSTNPNEDWPFLKFGATRPLASPAPGGTKPATGTAAGGETAEGIDGEAAEEGGSERVIDVPSVSVEDLTLQDLRPVWYQDPGNPNRKALAFDDRTYEYFRGKGAKNIAETVKTAVAKDASGRVVGLRITGFQEDAPGDVFDVRKGDILISINGQRVGSRSDAINIVQGLNPENLVTVVIERNGANVTYRVDPSDPKTRRRVRYFENLR